ncbi:MAG TPA: c-type cytochrome [Steroidobacter sp.]
MKLRSIALLAALGLTASGAALAQGSPEKGEAKSTPCVACHGPAGKSANPEWPSLAGQHASYIESQLLAFKNGERENPLMTPQAQMLSEEDIKDLAAYYAAQSPATGEADPARLDLGQRVYRSGDERNGLPACAGCHGPTGAGNPPAAYPRIGGQQAAYVAAQLRAYRSGKRQTDPNQIMRNIAGLMSDEQIDAVASYVQGLR